jgi:hypothetical protein
VSMYEIQYCSVTSRYYDQNKRKLLLYMNVTILIFKAVRKVRLQPPTCNHPLSTPQIGLTS